MARARIPETDRYAREKRAERLKQARIRAGFKGHKSAAAAHGWKPDTYGAHEKGQNGFSPEQALKYALAFKVSLNWLLLGAGAPGDKEDELPQVTDVPLISFVSAGQLAEVESVIDLSLFPTIPATDLPSGQWIALRVEGDSMNKISPPDSIIFVNLADRRLVANACYIVCDESGAATYKRYRPSETPPYQPASYLELPPPMFRGGIRVVGRVRRSMIDF